MMRGDPDLMAAIPVLQVVAEKVVAAAPATTPAVAAAQTRAVDPS